MDHGSIGSDGAAGCNCEDCWRASNDTVLSWAGYDTKERGAEKADSQVVILGD